MPEPAPVGAPTDPPLAERCVAWMRALPAVTWRRLDGVVAIVVFAVLTIPAALGYPARAGSVWAILGYGAAGSLPLAVRRRWPLPVFVVVVAATLAAALAGVRFTPFGSSAGPAAALAMYTVATSCDRRRSLQALVGAFLASWIVAVVAGSAHPDQDHNPVLAVAALIGWLLGDMVRSQRTYRAELEARRHDEADERARRGIAEERLRISREMHDVVSHNLSVIAVQSGVGRLLFDDEPEQARAALLQIESLSRDALGDMRRLLDSSSLDPTPGLAELPQLVERMTTTGLAVRLDVEGPPTRHPPMLELAAYRIVQEALTNVVKHTGGAPTTVAVRYRTDELVVEISNDGRADATTMEASRAARSPGAGRGIAGMRERTAMFGGDLTAQETATGGFQVVARLPVGAAR